MLIKRISLMAGLLFVLALIIVVIIRMIASSPQKTCSNFINYVAEGDVLHSYNLFSDATRSSTPLAEWNTEVNGQRPYYTHNFSLTKLEDTSIAPQVGQTLTLTYLMHDSRGQAINLTCFAVKSDKKYWVDGFSNQ